MPLPKPPRRAVSKAVSRQIIAFYEGSPRAQPKCVVTEAFNEVQFHHLDENPSRSDDPTNLVPLARDLNGAIERRPVRLVPYALSFDHLAARAGRCYAEGRYAYAYGCSVLGATLAWKVPAANEPAANYFINADTASFFCANALVSLRPLNQRERASDLLSLYAVPLVTRYGLQIERPTCARLAMEIGSYFRDAADYKQARRFAQTARQSIERERPSNRIKTLQARLWQHEGITAITEGDLIHADDCFRRAADLTTADYSIGRANDQLYHVHLLLRTTPPRVDEALDIVSRYHQGTDPLFVTRWTEIELKLAEAQALYQRADSKGAFERVRHILARLTTERVVPTAAVFPPVLRAFADEYPRHRTEVGALDRTLPIKFREAAQTVYRELMRLALK